MPIGASGDSGAAGVLSSGTGTLSVSKDAKYGYGPVVVPFAAASTWMRIYGQNSTPGTVQLQGAIYKNSGGSIGTVFGYPGSLLGTTETISLIGSSPAKWHILNFSPSINVEAGQYHFIGFVGGTTFAGGIGTVNGMNRWGPDTDTFSGGISDPYGAAGTIVSQFTSITINLKYYPTHGGYFQFDSGPGVDRSHFR